MPTEKEILNGLLSKVYQFDNDGVTSLYNEEGTELKDDALATILQKDAERVQSLKPDTKKIQDDWYSKGKSESLTKYEKDIATKYGLKTDKKGIEFIDELVAQFNKDNADDPEKIKKSKIFLDELERMNTEKTEIDTRWKDKYDSLEKRVEREKVFKIVADEALVRLETRKFIPSPDPVKTANWKAVYLNELAKADIEIVEGRKVLKNPDGSDMTDIHGVRVKFEEFVDSIADKYFDFYKADDKSAPNHKQSHTNSNSTVFNITSEKDYLALRLTVKPEELPALKASFDKFRGRTS
jgi:hypothetical protein